MHIEIPEKPAAALAALEAAGLHAWAVGGAVRDALLGRTAADWDITVAAQPAQLAAALPDAKPMGGVYGTVSWHGVEITPCRAEGGYSDHRHPDAVAFGTDLAADLARRDFTVNAMAWDGRTLTDPYGGQADLQAKLLRCVGEPEVRFGEDALRIMRLYRFAGMLGFAIEENTGAAARRLAPALAAVSAQRVRGELNKACHGARPSALAPLIAADGLTAFGFSGEALRTDPNALAPLDAVPDNLLCRWWALFKLTKSDAYRAGRVFDFGRSFVKDFARMDALYAAGCPADTHALKRLLMEPVPFSFADAAETFAAVSPAFASLPALYRALEKSGEPYRKEQLAVTPAELLVEGIPGRKIGAVQQCLLKAVVDTPALNVYPTLAQMAKQLRGMV